jgi:methylglutaconyl-CoA hydratase
MIRTTIEGGLGRIAIARPERRNALTPDMLDALSRAANELGPACDVILMYGEGPAFCAGFDLDLCRDDPGGAVLGQLLEGLWGAVRAFQAQPCPVIMAVHGAAIAGGCALLGGADIVVAEHNTKLGYPVTRLGISPGVSAPFLSAQIPSGAVRELQLDPGLITCQRARDLGLVSEEVDGPEATIEQATRIALDVRSKPREAVRATRRWLQELSALPGEGEDMGLRTSMGLVGGDEVSRMLPRAWSGRAGS